MKGNHSNHPLKYARAEKADEILSEIKELKSWLYGSDGFEGDIPKIKTGFERHDNRIRRIEIILAGIIGSGILGGGTFGLIRMLSG